MRARVVIVLAAILLIASGCVTSPKRLPAVPEAEADHAAIAGMPAFIRTWTDEVNEEFLGEINRARERRVPESAPASREGHGPTVDILAISGGGANGAYGAGILCGWTARGDRPTFELVTGISTGALAAPFAFLGPEYDAPLRDLYTTIRTKDVLCQRGLIAGYFGDAVADSAPLRRLIRQHMGADVMASVAAAYEKGRLLLVGTTNLDSQRGVVWNMGAIAASGHPRALDLFDDILLASASIGGAFPPVMLDVEAGGRRHQEMHVDGGTVTQVFVYPPSLHLAGGTARHLWLIRNSRLAPEWQDVERRTFSIASRSLDSLIANQGLGDLYRIYMLSKRDKIDYALASIPATFREKPKELFDPPYMTSLFQVGYQGGLSGDAWVDYPPGFGPVPTTRPPTPATQP